MNELVQIVHVFARELVAGLVILLGAWLLSRVLRRLIITLHEANHLTAMMTRRLQGFRRWAIFIVALLLLMQSLGVFGNAWGIVTTVLTAIAVGFVAVWSLFSNATAALIILVFRPFRIGDEVELVEPAGGGIAGRVVDMNLMYTTLREEPLPDAAAAENRVRFLRIPNNLIFQKALRVHAVGAQDSHASFYSPLDI